MDMIYVFAKYIFKVCSHFTKTDDTVTLWPPPRIYFGFATGVNGLFSFGGLGFTDQGFPGDCLIIIIII